MIKTIKDSTLWKHLVSVALIVVICIFVFPSKVNASSVLRTGSKGAQVRQLQTDLKKFGYYTSTIDGVFGPKTKLAVMEFQDDAGIRIDGIVGPQTLKALKTYVPQPHSWALVDKMFLAGSLAVITDIQTSIKFVVQRLGGRLHADVEPKTAQDTAAFKKIVGKWTWNRRPVEININGEIYPASINAMPHGVQKIYGNDFIGHFCVHFLNSKTHVRGTKDKTHQAAVKQSESYLADQSIDELKRNDLMLLVSRGYIDRSALVPDESPLISCVLPKRLILIEE
jgi:hypothetical protein